MARARAVKSRPCALEGCGRRVREDYQHFPYCNYHYQVAKGRSTFVENISYGDIDDAYIQLYRPQKTATGAFDSRVDMMASQPGLDRAAARATLAAWLNVTRGIDIGIPRIAREHRDEIIDALATSLPQSINHGVAHVERPRFFSNDGVLTHGLPHDFLVAKMPSGVPYVIDGAPAAMIDVDDDKDVSEMFDSGVSTLADGLIIQPLVEYCSFSDTQLTNVVTKKGGKLLWQGATEDAAAHAFVDAQRKLIAQYGEPTPPPVTYLCDSNDFAAAGIPIDGDTDDAIHVESDEPTLEQLQQRARDRK